VGTVWQEEKNWIMWPRVKLTSWLITRSPIQCERTSFPASFASSAGRKNISSSTKTKLTVKLNKKLNFSPLHCNQCNSVSKMCICIVDPLNFATEQLPANEKKHKSLRTAMFFCSVFCFQWLSQVPNQSNFPLSKCVYAPSNLLTGLSGERGRKTCQASKNIHE